MLTAKYVYDGWAAQVHTFRFTVYHVLHAVNFVASITINFMDSL